MSDPALARVRQRIGFYRSCYLADSRELDLDNLSKLADERWAWLDGREELTAASLHSLPLMPALGAALDTQQRLYQRELQLVYGVLPVCGRLAREAGPALTLCGPLLYYEARLEARPEAQEYFLSIDLQQPLANWRLLRALLPEQQQGALESLPLPGGEGLDALYLGELMAWVSRHSPVQQVVTAAGFPSLEAAAELGRAMRSKRLSLRSAALLALVPRGSGSRGVTHELQLLQEAQTLSPALCQLLGAAPAVQAAAQPSTPEVLPAQLSRAQSQALANAARWPLSLIAGPPGTGKSYTLAALALDRYLNGETVLLVSRSEQAVAVIAQKLREDFGLQDAVLEGSGSQMLRALRNRLERLLQGELQALPAGEEQRLHAALQRLIGEEQDLSAQFRRRGRRVLRWSALMVRAEQGSLSLWRRYLQLPWVRLLLRQGVRHWLLLDALRLCQQRREGLSREFINARRIAGLGRLLASDRQTFVHYNQAIRARNSQRQIALFEGIDPARLLAAFPIWVLTLDDLHRLLPLRAGLFDVMVIDEATQCDIASALPAFQRCRRAVVTGDARQLRHLSFLSRARETQLLQRAGLPAEDREQWSYRDASVLDLVGQHLQRQEAVSFLDEHFRSRPALIRFSNERFYNGRIKVMKERPGQEHCDSLSLERVRGQRGVNGVNVLEAERVLALLQAHIERYADSRVKPSVGVLSPFRDQVDYIRGQIAERLSHAALADFRLRVATPYGFQGEERDLMIISFAIDAGPSQAAHYLNRADMFNVAITRARERQVLLFSGDERQLAPDHLLRHYLERLEQPLSLAVTTAVAPNAFARAVCAALHRHGVSTWPRYPVAGLLLDIFCQRGDKCLAIDLIGYPGEGEGFLELERYLVLARAGLETLPLNYGIWTLEPNAALEALLARL